MMLHRNRDLFDGLYRARATRRQALLVFLPLTLAGCAGNPPPDLTPDAVLASTNGRVVHALDLVRDGALVFTNDLGTGQLPTPIARGLVLSHESSLKLIDVRSAGYVEIIKTSLAQSMRLLPPEVANRVGPYFSLASVLIDALTSRAIDEQLSAEVIAAYQRQLAESLAFDAAWLTLHP